MNAIEKALANLQNQQRANEAPSSPPRGKRLSTGQKKSFSVAKNDSVIENPGERSLESEEYRAIKRPILAAIDQAAERKLYRANIVMVTSSVPGEGKTFSTINLATSIAMERDRTVLLIDGDITNPSAGQRLGFGRHQIGLTDVLLNKNVSLEDVICESDIPNLRFIPAGSLTNNVTELLSSRAMRNMIESLSRQYRDQVIIFDSAPMLLTSEASAVADLAGQIVFVVAAESTTHGMVSDSLKKLHDHSRVGLLLNKTRTKQGNIYGYGYGYGYSSS